MEIPAITLVRSDLRCECGGDLYSRVPAVFHLTKGGLKEDPPDICLRCSPYAAASRPPD